MNLRFNKNTQLAILYITTLTICIGIGIVAMWYFMQNGEGIYSSEETKSSDEYEEITSQKPTPSTQSISDKNICGLQNRGNTCFFNASIQCILSMKDLCDHIKTKDYVNESVCKAFKAFIIKYEKTSDVLNPQSFIDKIKHKIDLFDGKQHDAQEFILNFFQIICEEDDQINPLIDVKWIETIECKKCNLYKTEKITPETIQGITICKSIQEGLDANECKEIITDYTCSNCSHTGNIHKERKIKSSGRYLILHLLRFNNRCEKIQKKISINEILNTCNKAYKLIGIVCHGGSFSGGHYWSYVVRNNIWYNANDSCCTQHNPSVECEESIYLAFYEEIESTS